MIVSTKDRKMIFVSVSQGRLFRQKQLVVRSPSAGTDSVPKAQTAFPAPDVPLRAGDVPPAPGHRPGHPSGTLVYSVLTLFNEGHRPPISDLTAGVFGCGCQTSALESRGQTGPPTRSTVPGCSHHRPGKQR